MSEERTRDLSDNRSFEERVFARFDAIDARFDAIDARLDATEIRVDARFDAIDARFDATDVRVGARFDAVDARLDSLDIRVQNLEARALDTKPIWERALAEILEVKKGVEDLNRKIDVLNQDVLQVRADQLRVERRMDSLESSLQ
jgi:tetrahydromethanopterin S-methyltransferase subunit G